MKQVKFIGKTRTTKMTKTGQLVTEITVPSEVCKKNKWLREANVLVAVDKIKVWKMNMIEELIFFETNDAYRNRLRQLILKKLSENPELAIGFLQTSNTSYGLKSPFKKTSKCSTSSGKFSETTFEVK